MKKLTMNKVNLVICPLFFCLMASRVSAMDLTEATELAKQYDTQFQAAYATYLATIEASDQSTAAILPQVGFNAHIVRGTKDTETPTKSSSADTNSKGYSLNLNQVIYNKTVFDTMDQGDAIVAQAVAQLQAAKLDVFIRVSKAYFDVLTAIDTLETATAEKKAIGKQLEQSTERFNVGLSAITDVKEQQASYDVSVANEITAINDLSNKREALQVIINKYPENLEIVKPEIPLAIPEPMDITAWRDKAVENNFTLQSSKSAVDAAQSAYDASKGGHYPTLSLNASYGYDSYDPSSFFGNPTEARDDTDTRLMLNLDIPIYSGGLTSSTVRQKLSELDAAKARYEQQKRITIALARSSFLSVKADIAQVQARKQAVISTQTSLDATIAGYDAGTRTSVDVLLSQRQLYSAQRDYAVSRHTYITDSLEMKRVAGILSEKDIEEINNWLVPRQKSEPSGQ